MDRSKVEKIFNDYRELFLRGLTSKSKPVAFILGGQPSSGKSSIPEIIEQEGKEHIDIKINGDNYRIHHPNHDTLIQDPCRFSEETQIFSNVFTEGLIAEAIKNRLTVSVEGTMRRSEVVENTVQKFKEADYKVELLCIAAPPEFTAINLFSRYASEVELYGSGRLADFNSHDQACSGLLQTLDDAYGNDMIDRIRIYEIFGSKLVADYHRSNSSWSITAKPSSIVLQSRKEQLARPELALVFIEKGIVALSTILDENLKQELTHRVQHLLHHLSTSYQSPNLSNNIHQNELLDEIDRLTYGVEHFKQNGIDILWNECKIYNNSSLFATAREHTGSISISQAFKMALDKRPISASQVTLDVAEIDGSFHLRVNGTPLSKLIQNENSQTIGRKR